MINVAIIIVTYNSLEEATRPCIESLLVCKTNIGSKIVIVDNGSTDATTQYIDDISNMHHKFAVIKNGRNLGFAAANNIGINSTDAKYYILLNNDTIVTDYWVDKLVAFLESHQDVAMVGPVSNSVGNDQIIYTNSSSIDEIMIEGLKWASIFESDYFFTEMLSFFCVAIRGNIFTEIGCLDEEYGLGMFEDDDFCTRVINAGYKLACLEEVFIYHKGSASFNKVNREEMSVVFERNRLMYESKHGVKWYQRYMTSVFIEKAIESIDRFDAVEKNYYNICNKLRLISATFETESLSNLNEIVSNYNEIVNSLAWRLISKVNRFIDTCFFMRPVAWTARLIVSKIKVRL